MSSTALWRLVILAGGVVLAALAGPRTVATVVLFIVVLGGIILVHELGHFFAARLAGVRVLEFGVGFPPRARVLGVRGETTWTLNWLPIGGFVKMDGEDGDVADGRSFSAKPLWVRLAILLAGVVLNVVLAAAIFVAIAWLATPRIGVEVASVQPASPAQQAGLVAGDQITGLDGQTFDVYDPDLLGALSDHAGQTVSLSVRHADGTTTSISASLRSPAEAKAHGALGISARGVVLDAYASRPLDQAVTIGGRELVQWGGLVVSGLGNVIGGLVTNPSAPPQASGPIGIAAQISDVFFTTGWITTLYMAGVLSINLAVVNILPFPPLDGGRMLVLVIKRVFGRRVSLRAEQLTYLVGFVFIIGFVLWITGFDIARQLGGGQ
ncbi:MAG TPA: M50 family metallopeptidase [Candidatus Limnocylindrales bacterium]|nr:M50 family metallopeptidase [Candidatus Limnocylindrales bacterium]